MASLRIRVQHAPRPRSVDPDTTDDEHLGTWLSTLVRDAVEKGRAGPVAIVVRGEHVDLVALHPGGEPPPMGTHGFLSGLTASTRDGDRAEAVGVVGRFVARRGPNDRAGSPVALVFLEWPDCRWWFWKMVLDAEGRPLPDGEQVTSAAAGDAMPAGLGRWWSTQRRTGVVVSFGERVPDEIPVAPHVH
ncbi:MAG: hypothetical protein H6738_07420 [Alphaproteobacteria bacterium]|nr:hypothetical protein [Alphaproteobacteria bacterium]MCB9696593.1 hypothetical protein [Alphaproteobacteria bacterium]